MDAAPPHLELGLEFDSEPPHEVVATVVAHDGARNPSAGAVGAGVAVTRLRWGIVVDSVAGLGLTAPAVTGGRHGRASSCLCGPRAGRACSLPPRRPQPSVAHARRRDVQVTTTPGVLTDDVADMAIGLLIMTLRDLATGDRLVRGGHWGRVVQPLARRVSGIRLGIIGSGQRGTYLMKRANEAGNIQWVSAHEPHELRHAVRPGIHRGHREPGAEQHGPSTRLAGR